LSAAGAKVKIKMKIRKKVSKNGKNVAGCRLQGAYNLLLLLIYYGGLALCTMQLVPCNC